MRMRKVNMRRLIIAIILAIACKTAVGGNTHALIVTGINKNAQDRQAKDKAVMDLRNFLLNKASIKHDRLTVAGCTADQHYSTRFSEYFVPALGENESDTDNDGKVSLLEAFTSASKQLDAYYRGMGLLKTETPVLEDNGDGVASDKPWRFKQNKTDGAAASKLFLSSEK